MKVKCIKSLYPFYEGDLLDAEILPSGEYLVSYTIFGQRTHYEYLEHEFFDLFELIDGKVYNPIDGDIVG